MRRLLIMAAVLAAGCGGVVQTEDEGAGPAFDPSSAALTSGLTYHGGPLMTATKNIYIVWYGNWGTSTTPTLVDAFAGCIGGTARFNINSTYTDGTGTKVSNSIVFGGAVTDAYSHGTTLTDAAVQQVVSAQISAGHLPSDANGMYFVISSSDVSESSGFCTQYCEWHTHATVSGKDIKYAFIGDPARCLSSCGIGSCASPNGASVDGIVAAMTHVLDAMSTDPDLNAWYDSSGFENADKCSWNFGTTCNGCSLTCGGHSWILPKDWVNASGGFCACSF